jgi:hypothetical protein
MIKLPPTQASTSRKMGKVVGVVLL